MIKDSQTNFLYLADTLPVNHPRFYSALEKVLMESKINYALLPYTRDIWAFDYMPIQVSAKRFVQFNYNPDYLRNSKKWQKTISDVDKICDAIALKREHSNIILDGGNVVKAEKSVIMTDKIFTENGDIKKVDLINTLSDLFEVERIIIIPQDPEDYTGHADGMVRFIDEKRVFVNNYHPDYLPQFQKNLRNAIIDAGLEIVNMIYKPDLSSSDSAIGLYINYLEIGNLIVISTFGATDLSNRWNLSDDCSADEMAVIMIENEFTNDITTVLDCRDIAVKGGVLNCISWKVLK